MHSMLVTFIPWHKNWIAPNIDNWKIINSLCRTLNFSKVNINIEVGFEIIWCPILTTKNIITWRRYWDARSVKHAHLFITRLSWYMSRKQPFKHVWTYLSRRNWLYYCIGCVCFNVNSIIYRILRHWYCWELVL